MAISLTINITASSTGELTINNAGELLERVQGKFFSEENLANREALIQVLEKTEHLDAALQLREPEQVVALIKAAPWLGYSLLTGCSLPFLDEPAVLDDVIRTLPEAVRFDCFLPDTAIALCALPLSKELQTVEAMQAIAFTPERGLKHLDVKTLTDEQLDQLLVAVKSYSESEDASKNMSFGQNGHLAGCAGNLALAIIILTRFAHDKLTNPGLKLSTGQIDYIKAAAEAAVTYDAILGALARDVNKQLAALTAATTSQATAAVTLHGGVGGASTATAGGGSAVDLDDVDVGVDDAATTVASAGR